MSLRGSDGETLTTEIEGERGDDVAAVVASMLRVHRKSHVSISSGSVGVINLGEIDNVRDISGNVIHLAAAGGAEIAKALACVAEAVVHSPELSNEFRADVLHQLSELSRQALLPPNERAKPGVLRAITTSLGGSLQAAAAVAQVWSTWGPYMRAFFGV